MTKPLSFFDYMEGDREAENIAITWENWDALRNPWKVRTRELRDYLFATDPTMSGLSGKHVIKSQARRSCLLQSQRT